MWLTLSGGARPRFDSQIYIFPILPLCILCPILCLLPNHVFSSDNTQLPGSDGDSITITGNKFGTSTSGVSVTLNGVSQTVSSVSDTSIVIQLTDNTAMEHTDLIVNVAGRLLR